MKLRRADIVLTADPSFKGRWIRRSERSPGEARSIVNHTGTLAQDGYMRDYGVLCMETSNIIESLWNGTQKRDVFDAYGHKNEPLAIFRHAWLTDAQLDTIVQTAESYVGRKYGYGKIVAHAFDYLLGGRYVFRKLCRMQEYPICSWVVAYAYAAAGIVFQGNAPGIGRFDMLPNTVQPDDIWDTCMTNPDWLCIHPFGKLNRENLI